MGRFRFVKPDTVRIELAAEAQRTLNDLLATRDPKATAEAQAAFDAKVAIAEDRLAEAQADHDFLIVKKQLTTGELRRAFTGQIREMQVGEKATLDPEKVGLTRILEYLVGWSFVDEDGRAVPVSESAVTTLDLDSYNEIVTAVDRHEAAIQAAQDDRRKNSRATGMPSPAI